MMQLALQLARRGEGRVEPNPMVGCVIARGSSVIGEGYHRRFGGPHAEIMALRACAESPRAATAYVTLEPCSHFGKTPPCAPAVVAAGIGRVVAAVRDPNPLVNGAGLRILRRGGVEVQRGVEAPAAMELLAPFATLIREKRPYVIAKWAQRADGRLVTAKNEDRWISSAASRRWVHRQRARVDAIIVGVNTVIADDPLLTARGVSIRRRATRVVLDRRLRIPMSSRLVATADEHPTIVLTSRESAASARARRLARCGVEVIACKTNRSSVNIGDCLGALAARALTNVVVEGGPTVLKSFFRAGLVDEAYVFIASAGKRTLPDDQHQGIELLRTCTNKRRSTQVFRSGRDTCLHFRLTDVKRLWRRKNA